MSEPMATETSDWRWPSGVFGSTKDLVAAMLWDLKLNGPAWSTSGQATGTLLDRLEKRGFLVSSQVILKLMRELEGGKYGCVIRREQQGKRTYRIELATAVLPPYPFPVEPAAPVVVEPEPEPVVPDPQPESQESPRDPVEIAIEIMSLGNELISSISQWRPPGNEEVLEQLYKAREESSRLRTRLREAEDLATTRARENAALQKMNRHLEANVQALLRQEMHADDRAIRKAQVFLAESGVPQ